MSTDSSALCLQAQFEEIEVLQSIYGDSWKTDADLAGCFAIDIKENDKTVSLYLTLPETYPLLSPPGYIVTAPDLTAAQISRMKALLNEEYLNQVGNSVIYQWIEKIREFLQEISFEGDETEIVEDAISLPESEDEVPEIIHGDIITDRKSVFQPHLARVYSIEQVKQVMGVLKQQKKIVNATHNMYAYRIALGNSSYSQDFDDDGETQAGSRMLHLIEILNVSDVLVVVSRWYGGVHLGPDRFRHINNATRQIMAQAGLISASTKK